MLLTAQSNHLRTFVVLLVLGMCLVVFGCGKKEEVSSLNTVGKGTIVGLTALSALSPGIVLLGVAYDIRAGKAHDMLWMGTFVWVFWIIAFVDWILDKIPGAASINHFVEHGLVWAVAYCGATAFLPIDQQTGSNIITIVGSCLAGSGVQGVRQAYSIPTDVTGAGAPIRSTIEDIVAFVGAGSLI